MHNDYQYNLPQGFERSNNICDLIKDDQLDVMGNNLIDQINTDIMSRKEWLDNNDKWMELVSQVLEEKGYPWPNASNIKFPLISTAAVQFHARAFPALLGNNRPIRCKIIGRDKAGTKAQRAERLSVYLSYQLLEGMDDWTGDMDRLLFILPIIGSLYKKTYYNEAKRQIVSELIHPRDLIINYDAIDIKDARKTHRIWKLPNSIVEMQNRGLYREVPNEKDGMVIDPSKVHSQPRDKAQGLTNPGVADDYSLQELYEVQCLWDLDGDGYKEPYVVTLRASDGKVLRMVANYDESTMERNAAEDLVAIKAKNYYTHYFFLPDPESKTHGIGFGTMIGPINEAVNTLINILTDSGHMHSLGGGFMARGIRMKGGAVKFRPNEWKSINTTGDDLRKGIMPLPTKEPSNVLFQLLGLMIDSGKDLSSVQDQMVGRSPGQNQPFATTQEVLNQGMKVFNGIYKRVYRSMTAEYKKIYALNQDFPDIKMYMNVLDMDGMDVQEAADTPSPISGQAPGMAGVMEYLGQDFNAEDLDVIPSAEPDMLAEVQKIEKANSLLQKMGMGMPFNPQVVARQILEAEGHDNIEELLQAPPPSTPPDIALDQEKFKWQKQKEGLELRSKQLLEMAQVGKLDMEAQLAFAKAKNEDVQGLHDQFMKEQQMIRDEYESVTKRIKVFIDGENQRDRNTGKQSDGTSGGNDSGGS